MLVAVIDLGTNTFNLLIAELLPTKTFRIAYNAKLPVKLGKGGINSHRLLPEAMERGLWALKEYKTIIDQHKVEKIYAFATSAIREASNRQEFVEKVSELGIEINVISGDKEAELIYKGVQLALNIGDKPALIIDIGGGSTEFVIANQKQIFWKQSFLLGVSRLLEMFDPSDPINTPEITNLEDYFRNVLSPLLNAIKQFPVHELIGSSGSFDSFAELIVQRFHNAETLINKTEYTFDLKEADIIFNELIRSNKEQRLAMNGLVRMRVDMIVMAAILTRFVVKELNLTQMRLSTFSLKEGVMKELMGG
jgi:exopolyphosphatase/guanosine-5'-triphosphate,3'-diphosphate pyrophosphatase